MPSHRQRIFRIHDQIKQALPDLPKDAVALAWNPPDSTRIIARKRDPDGRFRYLTVLLVGDDEDVARRIADWAQS